MASLWLMFSLFACFYVSSSVAYTFYAGGSDGWVLNPRENYNEWAGRNRFSVGDTLVFRFKNGTESVLLVSKDDYYSCNGKNPIKTLNSGTLLVSFKFDRSGPFFFIAGNQENCRKGQKLIVVVLAVRPIPPKTPTPGASPSPKSPAPVAKPPSSSGSAPTVSPSSPSPMAKTPSLAPAPSSPHEKTPSSAPVPALSPNSPPAKAPASAPVPATSPSKGPVASPTPSATSPSATSPSATSPSATSPSPAGTVESPAPVTSESPQPPATTSPGSSPDNGKAADVNAPPPTKSGSWNLSPSMAIFTVLVGVFTLTV